MTLGISIKGAEELTLLDARHAEFLNALLFVLKGLTLVGALVGGVLARKRRQELVELNLKLRQINAELRKRASGGVRSMHNNLHLLFYLLRSEI